MDRNEKINRIIQELVHFEPEPTRKEGERYFSRRCPHCKASRQLPLEVPHTPLCIVSLAEDLQMEAA